MPSRNLASETFRLTLSFVKETMVSSIALVILAASTSFLAELFVLAAGGGLSPAIFHQFTATRAVYGPTLGASCSFLQEVERTDEQSA